ncbi:hypothetical protein RB595_001623 [Gaeumannomyces hyphopodioides]
MSSESRLYTFSQESKDHLRKFRLGTSRAKDPQAVIYLIDKNTHEIRQDPDQTVYTSLEELSDDLPDHSPRFVLLSYPVTLPSGRLSVPNTSEVGKIIDIESADDLEEIPKKLATE